MEKISDGGPAFPVPMVPWQDGFVNVECTGMTLRDWFAGQALEGQAHRFDHPHNHRELLAKDCYEIADAMIRARSANA